MIGCFVDQIQTPPPGSAPPGTVYIRTPRGNAITIWQDGTTKENGPNVGDREWLVKAKNQPSSAYVLYLADRTGYAGGLVFDVLAFVR